MGTFNEKYFVVGVTIKNEILGEKILNFCTSLGRKILLSVILSGNQ
jgi:hypothetical protein